jgi:membrane protein DedA with SNARE-associated domain
MFVEWFLAHALYAGLIFILVLCGMGVPIPEEAVFLTAGYFGKDHNANVWILALCGIIGVMLGDSIPFYVGHHYGMAFLTRPWVAKLFKPNLIEKGQKFAHKHGNWAVFMARFVAGARMPAFFLAGSMGVKYWKFFIWDLAGALISCPISVWLAFTYGHHAENYIREYKPYFFGGLALVVVIVALRIWRHSRSQNKESAVIAAEPVVPAAQPVEAEARK